MILPGTDAAALESKLAARWEALRAWLVAAPRDPALVREINVFLSAWSDFEAQSIWQRDEGALNGFVANLNDAEQTASIPTLKKPDPGAPNYVPPGPPVSGVDVEQLADLTKELPDAAKTAVDDLKIPDFPALPAIPWYWKAGAAVAATVVLGIGAKAAYESSPIGIAMRLRRERNERAAQDEEQQRTKGKR